jgi:NhaA family Na+:H+ antiporter
MNTRILRSLRQFFKHESSASLVLALSTLVAMVLANGHLAEAYFGLLEYKFAGLSIHHWINDGLMTIFFFAVGMEIKRELIAGELNNFRKAALPVFAAIGGMSGPAIIYFIFNRGNNQVLQGWAIPMATDIAFAIGILTLLGKRVPISLKIFLLALAIADDLGAVLVIAIFYTREIRLAGIGLAASGFFSIMTARRFRFQSPLFYIPLGILLWIGVLYSGIHATVAGVIIGLLTPYSFPSRNAELKAAHSPLNNLLHLVQPWVGFAIMPLFALANAGIAIGGVQISTLLHSGVSLGVGIGLLIGKPIGILSFSALAIFLGLASRPIDLKWSYLAGASCLAGIGFTMAIFIANLALPELDIIEAKIAVLVASAAAALIGYCILFFVLDKKPQTSI